ncbi:hypothetical protein [Sphingobium sp. EM0848]|nr:hypothetical protein [Sphingobium sp. EM0848]
MMQWTLATLTEKMQDIDSAMLSTHADDGQAGPRPMSNKRDVA